MPLKDITYWFKIQRKQKRSHHRALRDSKIQAEHPLMIHRDSHYTSMFMSHPGLGVSGYAWWCSCTSSRPWSKCIPSHYPPPPPPPSMPFYHTILWPSIPPHPTPLPYLLRLLTCNLSILVSFPSSRVGILVYRNIYVVMFLQSCTSWDIIKSLKTLIKCLPSHHRPHSIKYIILSVTCL